MVVVILTGGLGNQMFQLASGYKLVCTTGEKMVVDTFSYVFERGRKPLVRDICNIENISYAKPCFVIVDYWVRRFFGTIVSKIRGGFFDSSNLSFQRLQLITDSSEVPFVRNPQTLCILSGYFQSPKYFASDVWTLFKPQYEQDVEVKKLQWEMSRQKSVSIHVRRGDYVNLGLSLDTGYYIKAVDWMINRIGKDAKFYLFSDDIEWCQNNLTSFRYIPVRIDSKHKDTDELLLMQSCKHNIIANSTYSWWGGYLNRNPNKIVIAPKQEFNNKEIIPEDWIRL